MNIEYKPGDYVTFVVDPRLYDYELQLKSGDVAVISSVMRYAPYPIRILSTRRDPASWKQACVRPSEVRPSTDEEILLFKLSGG